MKHRNSRGKVWKNFKGTALAYEKSKRAQKK